MSFEKNKILENEIISSCRIVKDFPKKDVNFIDISTIFENTNLYNKIIDDISTTIKSTNTTKILGIESRGFLFASPVSLKTNLPLILARKAGKVPFQPIKQEYGLEYGHSALEISQSQIKSGDKIAIIDDILATGGTIEATIKIIERLNAEVSCIIVLGDIEKLDYNKILSKYNIPIKSLSSFNF